MPEVDDSVGRVLARSRSASRRPGGRRRGSAARRRRACTRPRHGRRRGRCRGPRSAAPGDDAHRAAQDRDAQHRLRVRGVLAREDDVRREPEPHVDRGRRRPEAPASRADRGPMLQRAAPQSTPAIASACVSGARPTPEETSTDASERQEVQHLDAARRDREALRRGALPVGVVEGRVGSGCAPAGSQRRGLALGSAGSVLGTPQVHVSTPLSALRSRQVSDARPVSVGHVTRTPCSPCPRASRRPSSSGEGERRQVERRPRGGGDELEMAGRRARAVREGRRDAQLDDGADRRIRRGRADGVAAPAPSASRRRSRRTRRGHRRAAIGLPPTGASIVSARAARARHTKRRDEAEKEREGAHGRLGRFGESGRRRLDGPRARRPSRAASLDSRVRTDVTTIRRPRRRRSRRATP